MTCIRCNGKLYEWTLFLDTFNNEIIAHALSDRRGDVKPYQDRLCAKLFEEEMPDDFAKPDSNFQYNQIIEYCKNHDGDFTTADIRNTLKLTVSQLNNAKKDPRVKRVMVRREGAQSYYCPKEEDGSPNSI